MKIILFIVLCLVWGRCLGEDSRYGIEVRRLMDSYDWNTEDVSFQDVGQHDRQSIIIKRSGDVVGYFFNESMWERKDVEAKPLDAVTRIVFGYDEDLNLPDLFQIEDSGEIAIWIAAYRNHTEFERRFWCFMPTSKSAGFELKREEYGFGEACMCSLSLRFFSEDNIILELKGHIQDDSKIDSGTRNFVLHDLAKAKLPAKRPKALVDDPDPLVDPFAEEALPEPNKENKAEEPTPNPPSD